MKANRLFLIFFVLVLTACQSEQAGLIHDDDVILVEVDGRPISLPMLEYMMRQRGVDEDDHEGMRALLDELIRLRAVANAAEREGLAEAPEVRAARLLRDLETLQIRYFTHIHEQFPVSEDDIRRVYETQLERSGDRQFTFETVLFPGQSQALLALAALDDGEVTFEALAAEGHFDAQSLERTGWVDRSQVGAEIGAVLAEIEHGEVIGVPLQTEQGWRVLRVADSRALEPPPLDGVREGIARQLVRERLEAIVEDLYEAAEIAPMLPLEPGAGVD